MPEVEAETVRVCWGMRPVLWLILLLNVLLHAQAAALNPLQVDTSFGERGTVDLGKTDKGVPVSLLADPGGHVLVLFEQPDGALRLQRLLSTGQPDPAFAERGAWTSPPMPFVQERHLLRLPSGGLLVAQANERSALYQLSADGQPDTTFGKGGKVELGFVVTALQWDAQGRLVVAGWQFHQGTGGPLWALARLLPSGAKDTSFGGGFRQPFGLTRGRAFALHLLPDGTFLAGGNLNVGGEQRVALLARFQANGALDTSYAQGGRNFIRPENACLITALRGGPNDSVISAGGCRGRALMLDRWQRSGQPDPQFSAAQPDTEDEIYGVPDVLLPLTGGTGGRVLLAGSRYGSEAARWPFLWAVDERGQSSPGDLSDIFSGSWQLYGAQTDEQGRLLLLLVEQEEGQPPQRGRLMRYTILL